MILPSFKAFASMLEFLISLVFHVSSNFGTQTSKFIPIMVEFIRHIDSPTKKVAIDCVYSIAAMNQEQI